MKNISDCLGAKKEEKILLQALKAHKCFNFKHQIVLGTLQSCISTLLSSFGWLP